jgi:hypothetical protein
MITPKLIFLASILFGSTFANAQSSLKLYYNSSTDLNDGITTNSNAVKIVDNIFPRFSFALHKALAKQKYVEVEIGTVRNTNTSLYLNVDSIATLQGKVNQLQLNARLERGKTIMQTMVKKREWKFMLGDAAQLQYNNNQSTSYVSNIFSLSSKQFHVIYQLIPRINIQLSKKLLLDVNMPTQLIKVGVINQNVANPNIPVEQRKWSIFDMDFLLIGSSSPVGLRAGLGYKL